MRHSCTTPEKSGPARIYTCADAGPRAHRKRRRAGPARWRKGEDAPKEGSLTAELDGYAILGGKGRLQGYIDGEDALGVGLYCGEPAARR